MALVLVTVQQPRRCRTIDGGDQLPAQIHRVADAGVHALAAEWGVHVRRVARDEHPTGPVVPGLPAFGQEPRTPPHVGHAVVLTGDAQERVTDLVQRHGFGQRRLLAQPVPGDGAEPAVAERDREHDAALVRHTGQDVLRRTRQRHVGQQDVRLVLPADEVDADQIPDRAVGAVAPHHVLRSDRGAVSAFHGGAVVVLGEPDHLGAADDGHAEIVRTRLEHLFGAALRDDQQHCEPAGQVPQVERLPAGRRDLVHRHAPRKQVVGQSTCVEQFQGAGVHRESPGDVGCRHALLEHTHRHTALCEFTCQHQTRRAGTDHHDVDCVHEPGW